MTKIWVFQKVPLTLGICQLLVRLDPSLNFLDDLLISLFFLGDLVESCKGLLSCSKDSIGCEINAKINDTATLETSNNIKINVRVFVCDKETGVCAVREAGWKLKVVVRKSGCCNVKANLNWTIEK